MGSCLYCTKLGGKLQRLCAGIGEQTGFSLWEGNKRASFVAPAQQKTPKQAGPAHKSKTAQADNFLPSARIVQPENDDRMLRQKTVFLKIGVTAARKAARAVRRTPGASLLAVFKRKPVKHTQVRLDKAVLAFQ